jgi:PKD repeat protein
MVDENSTVELSGSFTDPGTLDTHTATINWGDGSSEAVSVNPGQLPTHHTISASHEYADNGIYTIRVTIVDDDCGVGTQTVPITVTNVAPTLTVLPHQTLDVGRHVSLADLGRFTDPGFDNPANPLFTPPGSRETFTYSIDWGDGSAFDLGNATIDAMGRPPGIPTVGSFDGSHIYTVAGSYTVTVTVSDDDGGSDTETFALTARSSVLVLEPTECSALSLAGNAIITISGGVVVNSTCHVDALVASGNALVQAGSIDVAGGVRTTDHAVLNPTPRNGAQIADPFAELPIPLLPPEMLQPPARISNGSITLQPGIYPEINISGQASVTLAPGIYVIAGGGFSVAGQARVSGQNVMIYNAGSNYPNPGGEFGSIHFTGNEVLSLTPRAAGPYLGLVLFQARDNPRSILLSGNASGMRGTIYAANAELSMSGNAQLQTALVVDELTLSGNANLGGSALLATQSSSQRTAETLTAAALAQTVAAAKQLWLEKGGVPDIEQRLAQIEVATIDLPGKLLGQTYGSTILIDANAAGHGWFVDATPGDDLEFRRTRDGQLRATRPSAAERMDLLSVVLHELGHVLGFEHALGSDWDVMVEQLSPGTRRLPFGQHARTQDSAIQEFFCESGVAQAEGPFQEPVERSDAVDTALTQLVSEEPWFAHVPAPTPAERAVARPRSGEQPDFARSQLTSRRRWRLS